eukprot:3973237-Pyramimonas_sp.AAC.1
MPVPSLRHRGWIRVESPARAHPRRGPWSCGMGTASFPRALVLSSGVAGGVCVGSLGVFSP